MLVGVSVESHRFCATADVTKACNVVITDFLDVRTVKTIVIKCTNICSLLMFTSFMYQYFFILLC